MSLKDYCRIEVPANLGVGIFLLILGLGLLAVSFTIMPVVGIVFAVPVLFLSSIFLRAKRSEECIIEN